MLFKVNLIQTVYISFVGKSIGDFEKKNVSSSPSKAINVNAPIMVYPKTRKHTPSVARMDVDLGPGHE